MVFGKIEIEIESVKPLLMNNPIGYITSDKKVKRTMAKYDTQVEAEKATYRDSEGYLCIQNNALFGTLINGSSFKKVGKFSAKKVLMGNIDIEPENVRLLDKEGDGLKDYEVDVRMVVIQRDRVLKARPLIRNWRATFSIIYNMDYAPVIVSAIQESLIDAGQRAGLLDYRPRFGTFKIIRFEDKGEIKT